uniref:Uncharacterized protein n=1 Tax=viral metagenome TaxID=1070528 RepID=A0A6H2A316_9ZZZZ
MALSDLGITNADFINGPLADLEVSVTVTPVTETEDFRGNKTFTDGTPYAETVIFLQELDEKMREKFGVTEGKASLILYENTSNINVGDKITIVLGDGTYVFKVYNQIDRDGICRVSVLYYWGAG